MKLLLVTVQVANQGVGQEAHNALSGLLCAWEGVRGAQAALLLTGITLLVSITQRFTPHHLMNQLLVR